MNILRKLRWVIYPSVFILVFLGASYCTFPETVVRDFAVNTLTNVAFNAGPKMRGVPKVTIKDVGLWRLSGINMAGVNIVWPPTKKDAALNFDIEKIKSRVSILPLLMGKKKIATYADIYGGVLKSDLSMTKQNTLSNIEGSLSKINLAKAGILESSLGASLQGLLSMAIDLKATTEISKDGVGTINFNVEKALFGPGNINLPPGGLVPSLSIPQVGMGNIAAKFTLNEGQLESKAFTFTGGDLEGEMQISIALGRAAMFSRLNGKGWFSLKKEFVSANETIKMLFDLLPELRAAAARDGKVGFSIRGTLARPQFKLENYLAAKTPSANKVPH